MENLFKNSKLKNFTKILPVGITLFQRTNMTTLAAAFQYEQQQQQQQQQ
jgi:hypothetical protein